MKEQLTLKKQTVANLTQPVKVGQNQKILITPMATYTFGLTRDLTWW